MAEYNNIIDQVEKDPNCAARVAFMARDWHHGAVQRYEHLQRIWMRRTVRDTRRPDRRRGDPLQSLRAVLPVRHRIKRVRKQRETFILQMSGFGSYLPTERAQAAGSYSAIPQSSIIGPAGGQMLVDKTVGLIDQLWK